MSCCLELLAIQSDPMATNGPLFGESDKAHHAFVSVMRLICMGDAMARRVNPQALNAHLAAAFATKKKRERRH